VEGAELILRAARKLLVETVLHRSASGAIFSWVEEMMRRSEAEHFPAPTNLNRLHRLGSEVT